MEYRVRKTQEGDKEKWNEFVNSKNGYIFHTWEWLSVFKDTEMENYSFIVEDFLPSRTGGISPLRNRIISLFARRCA